MKNYLSVFAVTAILAAPAVAETNWGAQAGSTANLTGAPAVRSDNQNVNYEKYETRSTTRSYSTNSGARNGNVAYYSSPSTRSQMYRTYDSGARTTATTNRTSTVRTQMKRKYYLAHPFFQPTEGKFGSITDFSYNTASYDLSFLPSVITMDDTSAKWKMNQFAIKEDFSFGITDKLGVLAMARYDISKYKFDWSNPATPDDKMDDDGLNIYGLGLQWRFVDSTEWIAMLTAFYERQKDVANEFALDLKGGYKVAKSTIYGLLRTWIVKFDEDMYGNGITGQTESGATESMFIAYDDNAKTSVFVEGGLGVFSVLGEDWTLNLEGIFGYYDWHNQAYVKGAFGWQPNDWFALNLYAKTSFYDTADGQKLNFYATENGVWMNNGQPLGQAKLDKYNEMSFGAQVIFYF